MAIMALPWKCTVRRMDKEGEGERVTAPLLTLLIPGPVLGKGRARSTRSGRHYTPAATRANEASMGWYLAQAWGGKPLLDEPLRLELVIHFEVPASWSKKKRALALAGEIIPKKKPDCSNILKSIEDPGNGVVWKDDAQFSQYLIFRWYAEAPSLQIAIFPARKKSELTPPSE